MKVWSEDECIEALRSAVEELGYVPTPSEYRQHEFSPSRKVFERRFGSFDDAVEAAGYDPCTESYSREDVLDAIREAAGQVEGRLTVTEYREHRDGRRDPSLPTVYRHFDGWGDAIEDASKQ